MPQVTADRFISITVSDEEAIDTLISDVRGYPQNFYLVYFEGPGTLQICNNPDHQNWVPTTHVENEIIEPSVNLGRFMRSTGFGTKIFYLALP